MNPYALLGKSKLNDFSSTPPSDPTFGPNFIKGWAGQRFALDQKMALKFSNTNVGTLRNGIFQMVRARGAVLADWVVGRPVFWSDTTLFEATTVAATTALLAGIAISIPSALGDYLWIQTYGDVAGLYAGALTKAVPALNDPAVLSFAASLATLDVILDATSWTNVQQKIFAGRVNEAPVINVVKRIMLTQAIQVYPEGII